MTILKLCSHICLANEIYDYVENYTGYELNRRAYLIGNCAPDIHPIRRMSYHNLKCLNTNLYKTIDTIKLGNMGKITLSYLIGTISHYIADTFCYAHNKYIFNLKKHIQYESYLDNYIKSQKNKDEVVNNIPLKHTSLFSYIDEKHQNYLSQCYSEDWDEIAAYDVNYTLEHMLIVSLELLHIHAKATDYAFAFDSNIKR